MVAPSIHRTSFVPTGLSLLFFSLAAAGLLPAASPQTAHPGKVIYDQHCLECHGDKGQGVKDKYDEPLIGDRTLEALARKIDRTMPEEDPDALDAEQSKLVADYIYEAFYSPAAQARLSPPEVELTRLTIAQYRTSVMDLIGRFRQGPGFDRAVSSEHGIKGFYRGFEIPPPEEKKPEEKLPELTRLEELKAAKAEEKEIAKARDALRRAEQKRREQQRLAEDEKRKNRKQVRWEKVEDRIVFHYGQKSPDPEKVIPQEFNNRWDGCVVAEETGLYEFIVKTENGIRLWVNDDQNALIDAWVSAGPTVREERKSIYLVGGRAYRLILEHFKFKEETASVELWWKPPHGVEEVIPKEALRNDRPQKLMIVSTNFPADDRSVGYERGSSISKEWDRATTEAAIGTATYVEENLDRLAGTKAGDPERVEKLKKFAATFAETAFRRPLTTEEKPLYVDSHFTSAKTPEMAVKRVVLLALKSPRFLYPAVTENSPPDDWDIAARLALALWDSLPDKKLAQAAAEKKLRTRDQLKPHVWRMMQDPRTKAKLHGFFHHWLELEHAENTSKDLAVFPGFDQSVLAELRRSLLKFIDDVVWSQKSDYRELLQADYLLLNDKLAKFYGKEVKGQELQPVSFDPKERAGIVTHPYLLSSLAYSKQTSPIHRGVFLSRNVVGVPIKPPPMAVTFDESHFDPTLTMREKITELTRNQSCMSCHNTINALGFSLENYDAIGRWRTVDNKKPVNPVTEFAPDEGPAVRFHGARDIVNHVVNNPAGHAAFIRQLFHHTVKQAIPAYGQDKLDWLQENFAKNGCHIQNLLAEIVYLAVLKDVPAPPPPAPPKPAAPAAAKGPAPKPVPAASPVPVASPAPAAKPLPAAAPNPAPVSPKTPAPAPAGTDKKPQPQPQAPAPVVQPAPALPKPAADANNAPQTPATVR